MDMADTCRVCLCGQRRLHAISNTLFQEMWEKLTNAKFSTNDGKSLLVCYLCCAQLRRSHQLMKRALEADKLLTAIVNSPEQSQNALLLLANPNQEDSLDNSDDDSGTPLDDNTLLKEVVKTEVEIVVERIDLVDTCSTINTKNIWPVMKERRT
ncbi:hypothetical protein K1T71_000717 [Dendrolimus kikuchii]|uniref:Uncharacterized protein n=1 Tax=Dendrolimus kikuchii TaxID=765133 RepID=A0ACC1DJZ2_9NEOP|nr:hypothetical protein K1T71_000717 [Dendrolimus kikuchii]